MRELNSFANEYRMETNGGGFPVVQGLPVRTMTPRDTVPVSNTQHRQQTPEANRVESQRRAAPAPSLAPPLTQEDLVTRDLSKLINTRYSTQSAQWSDGHHGP